MTIRVEIATPETPINPNAKKLFIKSYGCQMNVYDAIRMGELMQPHGYELINSADDADVVVLNTCHIREKADDKVYSDIGRMKRQAKGDAIIAVGGCMGQAEGKKVMEKSHRVEVVFGPQTLHRLPEYLEQVARVRATKKGKRARVVDTSFPELEKFDKLPTPGAYGPVAFVSIQEGCDKFCTYCVVPYTRGHEISRPVEHVLAEVEALAAQGVREVTLLGQNVNAYAHVDASGVMVSFAELMRRVAKIEGIWRIRFTTSHPNNMDAELIALYGEEPKLMPYLHFPVQAGSNKILQAMNRNHSAEDYIEICKQLRAVRPDVAIAGDFIVGFPGETEEDFLQTLAVVAEVNYAQAYSFAYSRRPGTPAASMLGQVEKETKMERLAGLQALLDDQQIAFNQQFEGQTVEILAEEFKPESREVRGRTPHNVVVYVQGERELVGQLVPVKITRAGNRCMWGDLA